MDIRVGQVYEIYFDSRNWSVIAITNIEDGIMSMINPEGGTDLMEVDEFLYDTETKLIAEYPTWQEAINSKEFKND